MHRCFKCETLETQCLDNGSIKLKTMIMCYFLNVLNSFLSFRILTTVKSRWLYLLRGWGRFPLEVDKALVRVRVPVLGPVRREVLAVVHLWAGHGGPPLNDVHHSLERHLGAPQP